MKEIVRSKTKPKTRAEKRVEILKDALLQLRSRAYRARSGVFWSFSKNAKQKLDKLADSLRYQGKDIVSCELNPYLDKVVMPSAPCGVCAKGAIALSAIAKYNDCTIYQAQNYGVDASQRARQYFGKANADRMEQVFEGWTREDMGYASCAVSNELVRKWKKKYPKVGDRLVAILKNAIRNDGVFKP